MTYRDGAVASVKDPYGVVTKLAYDRFRNLTEASDSRGNTSLYGYDLLGRCVSVTNPKGAVQKGNTTLWAAWCTCSTSTATTYACPTTG